MNVLPRAWVYTDGMEVLTTLNGNDVSCRLYLQVYIAWDEYSQQVHQLKAELRGKTLQLTCEDRLYSRKCS